MSRVTFCPYFRHWYPSLTVSVVSEGSIREQTLLTLIRPQEPSKASLGVLSAASALPLPSASPELGGSSTLSLFLFLLAASGGGGGGGDAACEARVEPGESGPGLAIWLAYR